MYQWSVQWPRRSGWAGWLRKTPGAPPAPKRAQQQPKNGGTTSWAEKSRSNGPRNGPDGPASASAAGARGRASARGRLCHRRGRADDDVWRAADRQFRAWRLSRHRAVPDLSRRDTAWPRSLSVAVSGAAAGHAGRRLYLQIADRPGDSGAGAQPDRGDARAVAHPAERDAGLFHG